MYYKTIHFLHFFFSQKRSPAKNCKLAFKWKTICDEKSLNFFVTHRKCMYWTSNPLQEKINKLTARTNQLKYRWSLSPVCKGCFTLIVETFGRNSSPWRKVIQFSDNKLFYMNEVPLPAFFLPTISFSLANFFLYMFPCVWSINK